MAPYYTRSKEVWFNGDGIIVSKHEIDHEVRYTKLATGYLFVLIKKIDRL